MKKLTYLSVFYPNQNGGFSLEFPDLPGCISLGDSFEHSQKMAKEALSLHYYGLSKDGDEIPQPSSIENLELEINEKGSYIIVPITIYPDLIIGELDNRAVKTNCTIPAWLKNLAEEHNVNYSQILQTALKEYLNVSS